MRVRMCECVLICVHVCVCICVHKYTCVFMYVCLCLCMLVCVSVHVCQLVPCVYDLIGLARTIWCIPGIFGIEIAKYTVMYGIYIWFWLTLILTCTSARAMRSLYTSTLAHSKRTGTPTLLI